MAFGSFLVTGAADLYVQFQSGFLYYLGTAEVAPKIMVRPVYRPWQTTNGGTSIGTEKIFELEEAAIVAPLNRIAEDAYNLLATRPRSLAPPLFTSRGFYDRLAVGSLQLLNHMFFRLYVRHRNFGMPDCDPRLPPGYTFFACNVVTDEQERLSTEPRLTMLAFEATPIPLFSGPGDFTLLRSATPPAAQTELNNRNPANQLRSGNLADADQFLKIMGGNRLGSQQSATSTGSIAAAATRKISQGSSLIGFALYTPTLPIGFPGVD